MKAVEQSIKGVFLIEPQVFGDQRGYFFESFNKKKFLEQTGIDVDFVQDNESKSDLGVLRGLHFQKAPLEQAKLIRVIQGKIFDVAVDIRPNSKTFGQWTSAVLSAENKHQLFIPKGFAHGFLALENETIISYKCDEFYSKEHEGAIRFDDPEIGIQWNLKRDKIILSKKDLEAGFLK